VSGVLFLAVVGAVEIVANGTCPSDGDVAERLRALVPEAAGERETAKLSSGDKGLLVELSDANGAPLWQRWLQPAPCADLAQAAAVVIAAWEAELRTRAASEVKLPAPRPPRRTGFEIDAAFLGSLAQGNALAAGGAIEIAVGEKRSHFLGRLELAGFQTRDLPLTTAGHVSWTRAWLALGPLFRFRPGRFVLDLHAEGLLALLYFGGVGFTTTQSGYDVDVGLGAGIRGAVRAGPMRFFLGVGLAGWLRQQTVQISGGASNVIPRIEGLLTIGIGGGND
jgi:hypothetical protein